MTRVLFLLVLMSAPMAQAQEPDVYSLYRASEKDRLAAVHIATFEAADGQEDNAEICWQVAEMLQARPEVTLRYWCKPGRAVRAAGE